MRFIAPDKTRANCEPAFTTKLAIALCRVSACRAKLAVASERIYERALTNMTSSPLLLPLRAPKASLRAGTPRESPSSQGRGETSLVLIRNVS